MPLLRNGEPYRLTEKDKEQIRTELGFRFPAVFKMPPKWQIKDPNPKNKNRIIRPPSVIIRTKSVVGEEGDFVTWQWSRSFTPQGQGKPLKGSDGVITFSTEMKVGNNEMDKLFYLLFCTPQRLDCSHSGRNCCFVLENKEKEATSILERDALQASAIHYITTEFSIERVRKIAAYYEIPGALDIKATGPMEIRQSLLSVLKLRPNGFAEFARDVKLEDEIEISAEITWLEDQSLLKFVEGDGWILLKEQTKGNFIKNRTLTSLIGQKNPKESLIFFLKKNPDQWELLKTYSETRWEEEAPTKPGTRKK
jgi:hypothetical protein